MELIKELSIDSLARVVWVSKKAKETWEKALQELSQFVQELEVLSVVRDQRPVSWQTIGENTFPEMSMKWGEMGLIAIPLLRVGQFEGFAHKHAPLRPREPANVCVIVSKKYEYVKAFKEAYQKGDNVTQGELLGYPRCCSEFFESEWKKGYYDPIWQAGLNSEILEREDNKIRVKAHPLSISSMRYCGLRVGFHITHSFYCEETIKIAEERLKIAEDVDKDKVKLLRRLLEMPHSWDCYHGIAIVRTPIFYIITSSVPTKERHVIEVDYGERNFIPREAERGLTFPFNLVKEEKGDAS